MIQEAALAAVLTLAVAGAPDAGVLERPFAARVVTVHDGDTITIATPSMSVKVRLEGIDCPELGQRFWRRARERTRELVRSPEVTVVPLSVDSHGRVVARVQARSGDLSAILVREGLAWHYRQYSRDPVLAAAEREARAARRGLWQDPRPVPPWSFRHRSRGSSMYRAPAMGFAR